MNETLADLQDKLVRLHQKLRDQLGETDDAAGRQALVNEMVEVTHRIQLIGGLLFTQEAETLDDKVKEISAVTKKVNQAIAQIQNLQSFLDTLSDFLGLVDEAIDLAKGLMLA
jgi:flagellar hook-associated protein FlgK